MDDAARSASWGAVSSKPKATPKVQTEAEKLKSEVLKAVRKNLSRVKGLVGQLEYKDRKLKALNQDYVGKKVYKDFNSAVVSIGKAKSFLMDHVLMLENCVPGAVTEK